MTRSDYAMTYEIKKGIPIPTSRPAKYPFAELEIGDCFDCPIDRPRTRINVSMAAKGFAKRHGVKFATRKIGDVVRCWRVE